MAAGATLAADPGWGMRGAGKRGSLAVEDGMVGIEGMMRRSMTDVSGQPAKRRRREYLLQVMFGPRGRIAPS